MDRLRFDKIRLNSTKQGSRQLADRSRAGWWAGRQAGMHVSRQVVGRSVAIKVL